MNSREEQAVFRVGKYGISQIPLNVMVGEMRLITTGKDIGTEKMAHNTKTYHKNYECALENLLDRMIGDNMANSSIDMIKSLIDSIYDAKKEIIETFKYA